MSFDFLFHVLLLCKHPLETTIFICFEPIFFGHVGVIPAIFLPIGSLHHLQLCRTVHHEDFVVGSHWKKSIFDLIAWSWLCVVQNIHRLVSASHELQRQKCKLVLLYHVRGCQLGFVL